MDLADQFVFPLIQSLLIQEVSETIMISFGLEPVSHYIWLKLGQCIHNYEHFFVIDGISTLIILKLPTLKSDRMMILF